MTTTRELDRLTEGWPDDDAAAHFELTLFAGAFHADRPELSAPALNRIGARLQVEMDRQAASSADRPGVIARIAAPVHGTLRLARRIEMRRIIPLATAASVLVGMGIWLGHRPGAVPGKSAPTQSTPVRERPAPPSHIPPEGPVLPVQ